MLFDLHDATVDDVVGRLRGVSLRDPQRTALGLQFVLARSAVAAPVTGTTVETTLASVLIPGGLLGPRGALRMVGLWSVTNNANAKTVRIRLGGTQIAYATSLVSLATHRNSAILMARGSEAAQLYWGGSSGGYTNPSTQEGSISTTAWTTGALDMTQDQTLTFTAQLGVGTDTATLEGYLVELMPG